MIKTQVVLSSVLDGGKPVKATALWDTGSELCGISAGMARALGLKEVGRQTIRYGNGEEKEEVCYVVRVTFTPSGRTVLLYATEYDDDDDDFIVGMSIIGLGTFKLERTPEDKTLFTFSVEEK